MQIEQAGSDDVAALARLLWLFHHHGTEPSPEDLDAFAEQTKAWWSASSDSHHAFVARIGGQVVGMAWVALVSRVPRPVNTHRLSADIQSVFVEPEHRGAGVGSALVTAAAAHAEAAGALHVSVHSRQRSVPLYERLGFTSSPEFLQRTTDG